MSRKFAGRTILLVEDETILSMTFARVLENNGYTVKTAAQPEEAVEAAGDESVDLVVMDINLGEDQMDGTKAAELILAERELPLIFLTSHTEKETVDKVKGITRYGYVVKDSGEFVLLEAIAMAFELFDSHQELKESRETYRSLFENMAEGYMYCKILPSRKGEPENFIYLHVNNAFEELTSLPRERIENKRATEVFPRIREEHPELFELYSRVVRTGIPEKIELFFKPLQRWFVITVYSPGPGHFVIVFENITEAIRSKEELHDHRVKLEQKNVALREMIEQVVYEKNRTVEEMRENISRLVLPILNEMEMAGFGDQYVRRLRKSLETIASGRQNPGSKLHSLSHREAEICNLIKGGAKNKEIASLLNISETTVAKHRMRIRKKLNIVNTSTNLESYLQTGG